MGGAAKHREMMIRRMLSREDGAPPGNDNAAKDHIKKIVQKANKRLPKGQKLRLSISKVPENDYERVRSRINSDYRFKDEEPDGRLACHWVADKGDPSRGHCVFFTNNGQGMSEPRFRVPLKAEHKGIIDLITKEMRE